MVHHDDIGRNLSRYKRRLRVSLSAMNGDGILSASVPENVIVCAKPDKDRTS
jgi:hypothetical protein